MAGSGPNAEHVSQNKAAGFDIPTFIPYTTTSDLLVHLNKCLLECMNTRNYSSPIFGLITLDCHIELHGISKDSKASSKDTSKSPT